MLRRIPSPWALTQPRYLDNEFIRNSASSLKREGIIELPAYISGEQLQCIRKDFNEMVSQIRSLRSTETRYTPPRRYFGRRPYMVDGVDKHGEFIVSNDPFRFSHEFINLTLDQTILSIIAKYFGRKFYLQHIDAKRLPPREPGDFSVFNWHHDAKGSKINVMFVLTEIQQQDQGMTYLKHSHRRYYGITGMLNNFQKEKDIVALEQKHPDWHRHQCTGPAGSVFLFDANGLHRGNRSLGMTRDTLLAKFSPNRNHVWELTAPKNHLKTLTSWQKEFLQSSADVTLT
jgi:hypothetical protein